MWSRGHFCKQGFPYKIFDLLELESHDDFLNKYRDMQQAMSECTDCFDIEFSQPLLSFIPQTLAGEQLHSRVIRLKRFLHDVSVFVPISSDSVECIHGFFQSKIHRFRGRKVSDPSAQELSLWSTITTSYKVFWDSLWQELGDPQAKRRMYRFDTKGMNQYTDPSKRKVQKLKAGQASVWTLGNMDKVCEQEKLSKKPKKLSGHLVKIKGHVLS